MIFCRVPFHDRGSRGQQRRVAGTPCADNVEQQVPRNGPPPPLVLHRRSAARSPYAVAFFPRHAAHTSHRPAAGSPASLLTATAAIHDASVVGRESSVGRCMDKVTSDQPTCDWPRRRRRSFCRTALYVVALYSTVMLTDIRFVIV